MNTASFGPIGANPMRIIHATLTVTTAQIVDNLEMASFKALNIIFNSIKRADLS
jgi:hypothetical protein